MAIFGKLLKRSNDDEPRSSATRVETRMSAEERERELARLREDTNAVRSQQEEERYQRRLARMKARGIPLRLVSRQDWEDRRERRAQRHMVA